MFLNVKNRLYFFTFHFVFISYKNVFLFDCVLYNQMSLGRIYIRHFLNSLNKFFRNLVRASNNGSRILFIFGDSDEDEVWTHRGKVRDVKEVGTRYIWKG